MSSLGDLLLGKPEVREKHPGSPKKEQHQHQDVIHKDDDKKIDTDDSMSRSEESFTNVQKVYPQRTVVKKDNHHEDDDCRSNASSVDDYVRELLDPNDRPRNVWHVVEEPQERQGDDVSEDNRPNVPSSQSKANDGSDDIDNNDDDDDRNVKAYNNTSPDEQQDREEDYKPESPPAGSLNGADEKGGRRERGHSRDKSTSSHRRSQADRHSDKDRRDDRERHRPRDSDGEKDRRHRSGDKSNRSRRRYDYSDDDDDDDVDLRDRHKGRRRHDRRSSRSRSRSLSKTSSRRRDRSRSGSQSPVTRRNSRTILVMQLSPRVKTRDLEVFFRDLGRVREVRLIMDTQTRRHKGIAYIEFEDAKTASKALASNGQKLCGVPMVIQSALLDNKKVNDLQSSTTYNKNNINSYHTSSHSSSRSNLPPNCYRVYVGSLHVALTEEMIRSVFEPFGPIIKVELMKDRVTGVSRGYAFLTYANIEDGQEAVRCLDGFELAGKNLRVSKSADKTDH